MKLEKAIEVLTPIIKAASEYPHDDYFEALKLATEALKRHKLVEGRKTTTITFPLPGETEE